MTASGGEVLNASLREGMGSTAGSGKHVLVLMGPEIDFLLPKNLERRFDDLVASVGATAALGMAVADAGIAGDALVEAVCAVRGVNESVEGSRRRKLGLRKRVVVEVSLCELLVPVEADAGG